MGLFDQVKQEGMGKLQELANEHGGAAQKLMAILASGEHGGIAGIVQQFHDKGLGSLVQSWVGTGQNLPATAAHIETALGADRINAIAAKLGIPPGEASAKLAQWLPIVIDKLTPNGKVPTATPTA